MEFDLAWVRDPKDEKPSVSLTIFMVSVLYLITMGVLQAVGKVQDTGIAVEFFGISASLYFGRRINFKGKNYATDIEPETKQETK